jgi:hypothetical protein
MVDQAKIDYHDKSPLSSQEMGMASADVKWYWKLGRHIQSESVGVQSTIRVTKGKVCISFERWGYSHLMYCRSMKDFTSSGEK